MSDHLEALLAAIRSLVVQLPPSTVDALARRLDTFDRVADGRDLPALGATPTARQVIEGLMMALSNAGEVEPRALALALRAASSVAADFSQRQATEIAWTGPATESVPVRRVDQVMYELIDGANATVLLATYAAYKAERAIEALRRAVDRGVTVDLVVELAEARGGSLSFDNVDAIAAAIPGARVYWWPGDQRPLTDEGRSGSMHAKCLVVDGSIALVSSANMTDYALERNMELGVLLRGGSVPRQLAAHFQQLEARGHLVRIIL
jgi:cardiolipin synthase A/B